MCVLTIHVPVHVYLVFHFEYELLLVPLFLISLNSYLVFKILLTTAVLTPVIVYFNKNLLFIFKK